MAVVAVIADNFRLDDAEAATDWQNIGGGAGGSIETDYFYQGTSCFARKGAATVRAINLLDGLSHDFDQVWQFDDSATSFVDETTDANSVTIDDWNFFVAGAGVNDYVAMGLDRTFDEITIIVSATVPGAGTYTVTWEYWNGTAWTALSGVTDGTNAFKNSGSNTVTFTLPTDWEAQVLNGSARLYYVRAIRDGGTVTTDPLGDTGDFTNVDNDLSGGKYPTAMIKVICTTPGLLDLFSVPGIRLELGSDASNYYFFNLHGSDTYPALASWLIVPIDPNIVAHRDGTVGTPVLTTARYYADRYDQTGVSQGTNQALDAVDIGAGLTLTGGDGADTDGVFQDFIDEDEGTIGNRWGYVSTKEGIVFIFGMLNIGTSLATVFQDTAITITFPDGLFAAGFSGITVDLASATTDVDWTDCNFFGKGTEAGEDTRPVITVVGTAGVFDADNCVFDIFATITLTSGSTLLNCTISNAEALIQSGATLDGVKISGATTADDVSFLTSDDPGLISNCEFTFSDGHAIEIAPVGAGPFTFTMDANVFTSYGADASTDAALLIKPPTTSADITINITNGVTPTFKEDPGYTGTFTLNNNVTVTFTGMLDNTEVRVYKTSDDTEIAGIENATDGSPDDRSFAWNAAAGLDVYYIIHNVADGETIREEGFIVPSTASSIPISQKVERNFSNP